MLKSLTTVFDNSQFEESIYLTLDSIESLRSNFIVRLISEKKKKTINPC